jgi:hypothetical protein
MACTTGEAKVVANLLRRIQSTMPRFGWAVLQTLAWVCLSKRKKRKCIEVVVYGRGSVWTCACGFCVPDRWSLGTG